MAIRIGPANRNTSWEHPGDRFMCFLVFCLFVGARHSLHQPPSSWVGATPTARPLYYDVGSGRLYCSRFGRSRPAVGWRASIVLSVQIPVGFGKAWTPCLGFSWRTGRCGISALIARQWRWRCYGHGPKVGFRATHVLRHLPDETPANLWRRRAAQRR